MWFLCLRGETGLTGEIGLVRVGIGLLGELTGSFIFFLLTKIGLEGWFLLLEVIPFFVLADFKILFGVGMLAWDLLTDFPLVLELLSCSFFLLKFNTGKDFLASFTSQVFLSGCNLSLFSICFWPLDGVC